MNRVPNVPPMPPVSADRPLVRAEPATAPAARTRRRALFAVALAAGALAGAAFQSGTPARAAGSTWAAWVAGVDATAAGSPELVVWNAGQTDFTIEVKVRNAAGAEIANAATSFTVGARQTVALDLKAQIRAGLAKGVKPYAGLVSVEVRQAADDPDPSFDPGTAIVHVTQYYGNRKSPKAGFVLRALFRDESSL